MTPLQSDVSHRHLKVLIKMKGTALRRIVLDVLLIRLDEHSLLQGAAARFVPNYFVLLN